MCYSLTASTPHEWHVAEVPVGSGNDSSYRMALRPSDLGMNGVYQQVFYWFSAVTFILLPLLLLSIFNSFLINTVNKSTAERSKLSERPRHDKSVNRAQSQEKKITLMLIAVVVLALVCQTPAAIALLYTSFHTITPKSKDDYVMRFLGNLFNLLTACNAALNFVLYCALSDKFRKIFMATFCKRCAQKPSPQHSAISASYATSDSHSNRMRRASSSPYRTSPNTRSVIFTNNSSPAHSSLAGSVANQPLLPAPSNHTPGTNGDQNAPLLQKPCSTVVAENGLVVLESCPDDSDRLSASSSHIGLAHRSRPRNPVSRFLRTIRSSYRNRNRSPFSSKQTIIITCHRPASEAHSAV
ncbi:hypothetical protein HAZT_HAZT001377 [Hyalella azteca]|uniref:G-protein coupled receptors family 1 profile domain-containing protein n=1 Tax=Hyalella azteca TaxID=294128 RepID=A0A6A0H519_HYAAZ|nr:hypothetical protein HAZT_HAZT001377 [Hyalella azteca]